jgi:hypothetical protein
MASRQLWQATTLIGEVRGRWAERLEAGQGGPGDRREDGGRRQGGGDSDEGLKHAAGRGVDVVGARRRRYCEWEQKCREALDREDSWPHNYACSRGQKGRRRRMASDERRATKETGEKGPESRRARQLRRSAQGPQRTEDNDAPFYVCVCYLTSVFTWPQAAT